MTDPVIDLSHWNVVEDFAAAKAAGLVGVIHKCTEGDGYVDPTYMARRLEAEAAGLLWGAYHFLRPGDMREQAHHFVDHVGSEPGVLLAADHEDPDVSLADLKDFLRILHDLTGQRGVLYSGHVIKEQLGSTPDEELGKHRLWIAHYTAGDEPAWPSATWPQWWLWQYTDAGSCPGIAAGVDCDRYRNPPDQLALEWAGGLPPSRPIVTITIDAPPGVIIRVQQLEH